jgi:hypothetical protein
VAKHRLVRDLLPIPVVERSKVRDRNRLLAGFSSSNPAEGIDVSLLRVLCCQIEVSATSRSLVQRSPNNCVVYSRM